MKKHQLRKSIRDKYEAVIGLEVHVQLLTESKIFSTDSAQYGNPPNTNISVISLGHPGVLPKLNSRAIEFAIRMGLACKSHISQNQIFDRKNYFYPDLPKGYQITQDKTPICVGGYISIDKPDGTQRKIQLNRIHMEEDAGKSIHQSGGYSLVDLNRAGVPLIEMVTEPEIHSSEEANALLNEVKKVALYLGICDGNMEEGSLRCDANISVRLAGDSKLGRKVEVKNMNSFRNVSKAIDHEIERQIGILEAGEVVLSETRTFNAESGSTSGMRTKEELNDYRYFPDPDLSPVYISDEWIASITRTMPDLPWELRHRLKKDYELPEYDAFFLTESRQLADYFIQTCKFTDNFKAVSNWMMRQVKEYLNSTGLAISDYPVKPANLATLINLIDGGIINYSIASKEIYPAMVKDPGLDPESYIEKKNLSQNCDTNELQCIIDDIIQSLPDKVKEYKKGKKGLIGLFIGEVMKRTKGKADPQKSNQLVRDTLENAD